MIEMSFKCLLGVFWPVLPRDVFRNSIKSLSWIIFTNIVNNFQLLTIVNYFCKKTSSQTFKWFLNMPWAIMFEAYLECSQKSMVESFCENSEELIAINYFYKKAPSQILNWVLNRLWAIYLRHIQNVVYGGVFLQIQLTTCYFPKTATS